MKRASIVALAVLSVGLGACVTAQQSKENMLSAAGFNMRPATTPQQLASLQKFPPNQIFVQSKNGKPAFFYADPTGCKCLYYGNQQNYQAYQQLRFQQNLADEQQMTAMMNQQNAYDMGPWIGGPYGGPGFWGPY